MLTFTNIFTTFLFFLHILFKKDVIFFLSVAISWKLRDLEKNAIQFELFFTMTPHLLFLILRNSIFQYEH